MCIWMQLGLIPDVKLVDFLDGALVADTTNPVKGTCELFSCWGRGVVFGRLARFSPPTSWPEHSTLHGRRARRALSMETCVSCLNLVLEILRIVLYNVLDRFLSHTP
jgi:hypothetical protein